MPEMEKNKFSSSQDNETKEVKLCWFGWEAHCSDCNYFEIDEDEGTWCSHYSKKTKGGTKACDDFHG